MKILRLTESWTVNVSTSSNVFFPASQTVTILPGLVDTDWLRSATSDQKVDWLIQHGYLIAP